MPGITSEELEFVSHCAEQTERFGMRLAALCHPGDVICLEGELGAGKTCLARGLGRGLGVVEPITSPTFVLVNEHRLPHSPLRFYHVDLYRLNTPEEAVALGLEEYLYGDGICVIEWAERARALMPPENLWITLCHLDEQHRTIRLRATGARYRELLSQLPATLDDVPCASDAEESRP